MNSETLEKFEKLAASLSLTAEQKAELKTFITEVYDARYSEGEDDGYHKAMVLCGEETEDI